MRTALAILAAAAVPASPAGDPWNVLDRWDRPPTVTASFKDARLGDVLADLGRQAGCGTIAVVNSGTKVTLEVKDAPYWTAVDLLAKQAGCVLVGTDFGAPEEEMHMFGNPDPLRFMKAGKDLAPAAPCVAGPARVALVAAVAERTGKGTIRFSPEAEEGEAAKTTLRLRLKAALLDGLERVEIVRVRVEASVDEKGRKLKVVEDRGGSSMFARGGDRWIELDPAGGYGERLAELAGAVEVLVPRGEEAADLDLGALPATATIGGCTIRVEGISDDGMTVALKGEVLPARGESRDRPFGLHVVGEEGEKEGMFGPRIGELRFTVRDAAGRVLESSGSSGSGMDGAMTYELDLSGRPAKVTVRACTKAETREVPFRFVDVPLPR